MLLALFACVTEDPAAVTTGPTWHADVAPIVVEHCADCHADGQVGPFPLGTYDEVAAMGAAVADSVVERRMPPWLADAACNDYRDDISLTDDEITTIAEWVDAGMPEGDAATAAPIEGEGAPALTRVDFSLEVPTAYTPTQAPDDYRCFAVDWPLDEATYVTGYDIRPGNPAIVHHVIAYLVPPDQVAAHAALDEAEEGEGWTCFGGTGAGADEDAEWLGGWAPGGTNGDLPNGTGISVEPGSQVVLQVHYNTASAAAGPDLSAIDIMVDDSVESPARIQPWTDPEWLDTDAMLIPAGSTGTEHGFAYTMPDGVSFRIHTANLHMHTLGTDARLWVERADGTDDCLLDIPRWDFAWQRTYVLAEPMQVEGGDTIHVACRWDNPGAEDVTWGEGTGDEMCLGTMLWSY